MERKKGLIALALILGLGLVMSGKFAHRVQATTTVGGTGLKANGVDTVTVLPFQPATRTCFSVKLSSANPTLIMAANANRSSFYIVNASTYPMNAGTPVADVYDATGAHMPRVWLTTAATTNLGVDPLPHLLPTLKGEMLGACMSAKGDAVCRHMENGVSVFRGAVYGIAESSKTIAGARTGGYDPLAYVQGCFDAP